MDISLVFPAAACDANESKLYLPPLVNEKKVTLEFLAMKYSIFAPRLSNRNFTIKNITK